MSKPRIYNTTRFDGGMTNDLRDLRDPSKFAFLSHFDIYTEPHKMSVMPGWLADDWILGQASGGGLKTHQVRAFTSGQVTELVAIGTKADGTGHKIWFKTNDAGNPRIDGTKWSEKFTSSSEVVVEGDGTLLEAPGCGLFRTTNNINYIYPIKAGGQTRFAHADFEGVKNENIAVIASFAMDGVPSITFTQETGSNGVSYFTDTTSNLGSITGINTVNLNVKSTGAIPTDIHAFGSLFLILAAEYDKRQTRLIMWDFGLDQQVVTIPNSLGGVVGNVGDVPVVVTDDYLRPGNTATRASNSSLSFTVRAILGNSSEIIYRFTSPSDEPGQLLPLRGEYKGGFLFYAKVPTNEAGTEFKEGIWCVNRKNSGSPIAVSLLVDTSTVGRLNGFHQVGNRMVLAAGEDWGVYQLDDYVNGTYNIDATAETLLYGSETPYEKQLEGVTVLTDPLATGESIEMYYRTSVNDEWILMATSTEGERHNFTNQEGNPVGKFQEIQFKLVAKGKITIRSMTTKLTELSDIVYGL